MIRQPVPSRISKRRITVMQGESEVSRDPDLVLTTILGSCIACCLYDPFAQIGGMNHFLLPAAPRGDAGRSGTMGGDRGASERYGLYAMEVLVNAMLNGGATRATMRARIYGGANMHSGMRSIGEGNAEFARKFLKADGILLVDSDIGGVSARRLEFQPATGRVRCRLVQDAFPEPVVTPVPPVSGSVELF